MNRGETMIRNVQIPELHQRVLSVIPTGREDAITISYILDKLGLNVNSRREVSQAISDLIFKYQYPIGTSSDTETKGVFLINDDEDLRLACRTLNSRAMNILNRHKQIITNFNNRDQIGFEDVI
jgi:hypothetical protein